MTGGGHATIFWTGAALATAGLALALAPIVRRVGARLSGRKRRRSRMVCTIQENLARLYLEAERWQGRASGHPEIRSDLLLHEIDGVRRQLDEELLCFRGVCGFSGRQRLWLKEMERMLGVLATAVRASVVPNASDPTSPAIETEDSVRRTLDAMQSILDPQGRAGGWPRLQLRYRFWPFVRKPRAEVKPATSG